MSCEHGLKDTSLTGISLPAMRMIGQERAIAATQKMRRETKKTPIISIVDEGKAIGLATSDQEQEIIDSTQPDEEAGIIDLTESD